MAWEASRGSVGTGLGRHELARLPERTFLGKGSDALSGADAACAVCMCEYEKGDALAVLPGCMHAFHPPCVARWLEEKPTCPVCMRDVRADLRQ